MEEYDAALCDLDGVLHLGDEPVRRAAASVAEARAAGMAFAFVTNNASRAPDVVAARLTRLQIPAQPGDVVTSAQAAARVAAELVPPASPVLVVGTQALADELRAVGLEPVRTAHDADGHLVAAVVQGLAPETTWDDLAEAVVAVRSGAAWVAGNTDGTLPTPRGLLPGNGALVDVVRTVTGCEPVVAGKPEPALHRESVDRVGAQRPLVVGDRLDTDVLGAVRGGADSLLVLTGVTGVEELLAAPRGQRPTYVSADLGGLLVPHPPVAVSPGGARCGSASASYEDGVAVVSGDDLEALRALAALVWTCRDAGRNVRRWERHGAAASGW